MATLTTLMKRAGITQAALARLAKTTQPQINRLVKGERELTKTWADKIAPHLGVSSDELMFGDRTVPLVGFVGANSGASYYAEADANLGFAKAPPGVTPRTVAVEIRGDSLGGAFNGWLIYYDDRRDPPTDDLIGGLCVVGLASGQVLVKVLMRGRSDGRFDLFPGVTGTPLTDQIVDWAARVTAIMPPSQKTEVMQQVVAESATAAKKKRRKRR